MVADSERIHSAVPSSSVAERLKAEAESLKAFITECEEAGINPYDYVNTDPAETESFRRDMEKLVEEGAADSGSDSEDEGMQNMVPPNDAFEQVKSRKVGVWKLEYAVALAIRVVHAL